ncbi:MAG TPA: amidase [Thermomicrobiales bacterium]|nr:amidase [Thermomicrobiales bacterium]
MSFDLKTTTLQEAIAGLDNHDFSSVELIDATIARLQATEPEIHAYVEIFADEARSQAQAADQNRAAERVTKPLLGIPIGVKDIFDVVGVPTRSGSKQRANVAPAAKDAPVVARWREDGAIFTGKTVTQEYAAGVVSHPARNPWNPDHIPGGSSGGSAASVAIGSCLGAMGSDTGGSIRIPAAVTGIVGLKPTFGRLTAKGVYPLSPSLDTVGPLARSVADAAILYLSMAGRTAEIDGVDSLLAPYGSKGLEGVRIGILSSFFTEMIQPDVATAFADAVQVLRDLGATIVETDWSEATTARAIAILISRIESGTIHHDNLRNHPELILADARIRFEAGQLLPANLYLRARMAREVIRDSIARVYAGNRLDAIAAPTLAATAPRADNLIVEFPEGKEVVGFALTRYAQPWNATGQPVITVPSGADGNGLPIGLAIVGRPDDEIGISRIAAQYEQATGWFQANAAKMLAGR